MADRRKKPKPLQVFRVEAGAGVVIVKGSFIMDAASLLIYRVWDERHVPVDGQQPMRIVRVRRVGSVFDIKGLPTGMHQVVGVKMIPMGSA